MLAARQAEFDRFLAERAPALTKFAAALKLDDPAQIVSAPDRCLPAIDEFVQEQVVQADDRFWIMAMLGYFIGDVLVQRLDGRWFLNDNPHSANFAHYVVGEFARVKNPKANLDPAGVANLLLGEPAGRSLTRIIADAERELREA